MAILTLIVQVKIDDDLLNEAQDDLRDDVSLASDILAEFEEIVGKKSLDLFDSNYSVDEA